MKPVQNNIWRALSPVDPWHSAFLIWFNGPFTVTVSVEFDEVPGHMQSHQARIWIDRPPRQVANHPVEVEYIDQEIHLK